VKRWLNIQENKMKNNMTTSETKKDFLIAAINDLSSNIKFLDTKISILMAILGIIITGFISIRDTLFILYNQIICQYLKYIFIVIFIMYFLLILASLFFGIKTITPRNSNTIQKSLWFFSENDYSLEEYKNKLENAKFRDILNNLSYELFKLNIINENKFINAKRATLFFSISLILLLIFIIIAIYIYVN